MPTLGGLAECPLDHTQAFNRMVDRKMARSPLEGLIIYPEGIKPLTCGSSSLFWR